jgi:hypothetical protein
VSDLKTLQVAFTRHLMAGEVDIAAQIAETPGPAIERRLSVYANAYHGRLAEALATDYEALEGILGEEDFARLCRRYVDTHPSTYPSLRWLGGDLAAFLERQRPEAPDLAELARFEWGLAAAFDAPDAPVAGLEAAQRLPPQAWATLRLTLHPSVRRLDLAWNTMDRWRAAKAGEPIPAAQRLPEQMPCLIWRDALITRFRSLEADEAAALAGAADGESFAEICVRIAAFVADEQDVARRAAGLFKGWLEAGLVEELIT